MSVNSIQTKPQGMPDYVVYPEPDLSRSISLVISDERGSLAPLLPFPRHEDLLTLAIADPYNFADDIPLDSEEMRDYEQRCEAIDEALIPVCGGLFKRHAEFCLPWNDDDDGDEQLAHYLGVIARDEMGDATAKLVKAGVPVDWIILLDWEGDRVWPV